MNKEELKAKLTKLIDKKGNYNAYSLNSKQRIHAVGIFEGLTEALKLIDRLDEPELPVIPQFVADWIVNHKDPIFDMCANCEMWGLNGDDGTTDFTKELSNWFDDNTKTYYRACQDGYTIEPPKTRQVLVKFFDNEEYKTELTEEAAKELIEFLEANKHE